MTFLKDKVIILWNDFMYRRASKFNNIIENDFFYLSKKISKNG